MGWQAVVKLVCLHNLLHVEMYAETRCIRNLQLTADDLWRIVEEILTILPDPVGIERSRIADRSGTHLGKCCQCDVEVVVGVHAPGKAPGVQKL